jgi:hypothetical protein
MVPAISVKPESTSPSAAEFEAARRAMEHHVFNVVTSEQIEYAKKKVAEECNGKIEKLKWMLCAVEKFR